MKFFKKLICILLLFAICICTASCSFDPFKLNTDKYAVSLAAKKQTVDYRDASDESYVAFLSRLSDFSAVLSSSLYDAYGSGQDTEDDNLCFSPLSVYMALALSVECSEGETRQEILNALGMSYEEVRAFTRRLYAFSNRSFNYTSSFGGEKVSAFEELHNSVWLDGSVSIDNTTASGLSQNYNADVFKVDFGNGEAERVIGQYIKDKTHGLIDGDINMNKETVFALINTFYLKEIWNEMGRELERTENKYSFENTDGSKENTYLLKSSYQSGRAYRGENYSSFFARTHHGFELHFVLPDEGTAVKEVFSEETLSDILKLSDYASVDEEKQEIHFTRMLFPEFEAKFDGNIEGILKDGFGIERLFSPELAELSVKSTEYPLYCSKVVHKTALKVDKKGIEGAAVTAVLLDGAAGAPIYEKVYHDMVIDRAFGFILTDSFGTVLFSGVINEID